MTVEEHMLPCPTLPAALGLTEAIARLSGAEYAVVVEEGQPLAVVNGPDLTAMQTAGAVALNDRSAPLPPAIVVGIGATLSDLVASPVITLLDLQPEVRGLVVVDVDGDVAGVMPASVIDEYLGSGGFVPRVMAMGPGGHPGDPELAGPSQLGRARVRCCAVGCGYVNVLAFFDPHRPPNCQNPVRAPHRLALEQG